MKYLCLATIAVSCIPLSLPAVVAFATPINCWLLTVVYLVCCCPLSTPLPSAHTRCPLPTPSASVIAPPLPLPLMVGYVCCLCLSCLFPLIHSIPLHLLSLSTAHSISFCHCTSPVNGLVVACRQCPSPPPLAFACSFPLPPSSLTAAQLVIC